MRTFLFASVPAFLVSLSGCTGKEEEDSSDPPDLHGEDTADCNANAPVLTSVTINNGGLQTFDDGEHPTVGIEMQVEDDDGDLDVLSMYVWFDAVVDGTVDVSGEAPLAVEAWLFDGVDECTKFTAGLTLKPEVSGGMFEYNARYEFAVVAKDHHQVASAPMVADGVTPQEDGSNGNAP